MIARLAFWRNSFAAILALTALGGAGAHAVEPQILTSVRAVSRLSNEEAARRPKATVQGTVTYYRPYEGTLFIQDGDAGVYVAPPGNTPIAPGDRVEVSGSVEPSFRPIVKASKIRLIDHPGMPEPVAVSYRSLIQADEDCLYVRVRGKVRSAIVTLSTGRQVTVAELLMEGGSIGINIDTADSTVLKGLLDAEVEARGTVSGRFDGKMEQTGILLHANSMSEVTIVTPPEQDSWQLPLTQMDRVLDAYDMDDRSRRVRVTGTLTYYHPSTMAVLQDGARSIRVLTPQSDPLQVGLRAEATGIPLVDDGFLTLRLGQIRTTGKADPIAPLAVTWEELAGSKHAFDLVSIEGVVVTEVQEESQDVYVISSNGKLFQATQRHPFVYDWNDSHQPPPMKHLAAGSRVRVTGVAMLDQGNPFNGDMAFGILLRTPEDITVLMPPGFWTVSNLAYIAALLLLLVIAVSVYGWSLERKVRQQTAALAARTRVEAALERRVTQMEKQRGKILEDINSGRPLAEILEQIAESTSLRLDGAPCWCEIADGARLGNPPANPAQFRVAHRTIQSRSDAHLGILYAAFKGNDQQASAEEEALEAGARLATLAIDTRRLYSDLLHRSEYDMLTDIHNRFSLERRILFMIDKARENASTFGLIYIDLDGFKQINDTYGHQIGDLYLQEASVRMKHQLRSHDMLARLGGDEFAVVVSVVPNRTGVEEIANRLARSFDIPFKLEGCTLKGAASIGFALYPEDATTKDSLLHAADEAMYQIKRARHEAEGKTHA